MLVEIVTLLWLFFGGLYVAAAKGMTPDWKFGWRQFFQILGGPLSFFFGGDNII